MPRPLENRKVAPICRAPRAWIAIALLVAPLLSCGSDRPLGPVSKGQLVISGLDRIHIGDTTTLVVTAYDAHGNVIPTPPLQWRTGNAQVAEVNNTGRVLALTPGGTAIYAKSDSLEGYHGITVDGALLALVPLPEFGDTIRLAPGQTLRLFAIEYDVITAAVSPSLHSTLWTSSRGDLASVNDSGIVQGIGAGVTVIQATMDGLHATRTIEIAPTAGTASVRFVNAFDTTAQITLVPGAGVPVALPYRGVSGGTVVPAGTLQILAPAYPPTAMFFDPDFVDAQQFTGFLPPNSGATFIVTPNDYRLNGGPIMLAPVWDWSGPIAPDSVMLRVVLAAPGGYNVYYTDLGAPIGTLALQGCYLDWPYGVSQYSARAAGAFDIVLQRGKQLTGPETTRITVTPAPGRATTYVLAGANPYDLTVIPVVDP
jgi:hypothetical protein